MRSVIEDSTEHACLLGIVTVRWASASAVLTFFAADLVGSRALGEAVCPDTLSIDERLARISAMLGAKNWPEGLRHEWQRRVERLRSLARVHRTLLPSPAFLEPRRRSIDRRKPGGSRSEAELAELASALRKHADDVDKAAEPFFDYAREDILRYLRQPILSTAQ